MQTVVIGSISTPLERGVIVTHPGVFHADEIYAIAWIMRFLVGGLKTVTVVRTRDEEFLTRAKENPDVFVVDVGDVFAPSMNNFDHHQPGAPRREWGKFIGVPYAACGLVSKTCRGSVLEEEYECLEATLVVAIDAGDTGSWEGHKTLRGNPDIHIPTRSVAEMIHAFNAPGGHPETFLAALAFAETDLGNAINGARARVDSRERVRGAVSQQFLPVLVLDQFEMAAGEILAALPGWLYMVFPDEQSGTWRVQQIPVAPEAMQGRKPLPAVWHGLRGAAMDAITGIPGGIFVAKGGWIAGHTTREGAIALATCAAR